MTMVGEGGRRGWRAVERRVTWRVRRESATKAKLGRPSARTLESAVTAERKPEPCERPSRVHRPVALPDLEHHPLFHAPQSPESATDALPLLPQRSWPTTMVIVKMPPPPLPPHDPEPSWPLPDFTLRVENLAHPGAKLFFDNIRADEALRYAVVTVCTWLYTSETVPTK